ncbi:MAG: adenylate/guanylate cyclase domain-containing protein [Rhodobacteraceae bacterium]|nr:adenylate/guanylate cyclase domain-containing protein [Paracoccaceae bacterium]
MRSFVRSIQGKRLFATTVAVLSLALIIALRFVNPDFLTSIRELTFDGYQRLNPIERLNSKVQVIEIDEASIEALGQWPWPRTKLATLVETLAGLGAQVIAFDMVFSEADRLSPASLLKSLDLPSESIRDRLASMPDNDDAFAATIAKNKVVLGFALKNGTAAITPRRTASFAFTGHNPASSTPSFASALTNLPKLESAASGIGSITLSVADSGGIVRRIPLVVANGADLYPSFVTETLRVALGARTIAVKTPKHLRDEAQTTSGISSIKIGPYQVPTTYDGALWSQFRPYNPSQAISAHELMKARSAATFRNQIEGHIVLIGASATGLLDLRTTPLKENVPGVTIHAQGIEQILAQDFLTRPDWANGAEILATGIVGLIVIAAFAVFGSLVSALTSATMLTGLLLGSWFLFKDFGLLLDPVFPVASTIAVFAICAAFFYILLDREKRFIRQAFGQYLAPSLVQQLEERHDSLALGGEMKEITVMFLDIRDFTSLAEQLEPDEVIQFLNHLFSPLSQIIQHNSGMIDKYQGDSIMAIWNAPIDVKDHANCSCKAAQEMLACVDRLNAEDAFGFKARNLKKPEVRVGIGLNTGEACVGNIGSLQRFNYSAIGDTVNIAARIESCTKRADTDFLVSQTTSQLATNFAFKKVGTFQLKGKVNNSQLFTFEN